jgi:mono/diheme cytochrome c family protein
MKSIIFVSIVGSMMAALFPWQAVNAQTQPASSAAGDPGKAIFSGRCGKCHDADASKKLHDGTTLLGRLAKNKDPESRLATRLKNEQERHQVFLYLQPLIERERLSGTRQGSVTSGPK